MSQIKLLLDVISDIHRLGDSLQAYADALTASDKLEVEGLRTSWDDAKSQTGAFKNLENAKKSCKAGYSVFDENGAAVFTAEKAHKKGDKISLKNTVLYTSSTAKSGVKKTGTFYLYDGVEVNGRYRITTKAGYCGKTPIGKYVTGWVEKKDIT